MRNNFLSKMQHLLFVTFLLALTGCGANNLSGTADNTGTGSGSIAAKLQWSADGKTTAKTVAAIPAGSGITKMRFTVTGAGVPVVRSEIAVDNNTTGGQVSGIYPGKVSLVVQALNAAGATVYEGFALNVVVTAGNTTDVGTISMTVPTVKTADATCLGCHETYLDATGQNLIANYKQSGHYTNVSWAANAKNGVTGTGCAGCHGPSHNDTNPALSGRCFECHGSLGIKHQNAASMLAGDTNPARYLSVANNNCSACHEPHNPLNGIGKQERKDWAESAHGDVNGLAWKHYDFTIRDTCNACHTSAGFAKALGNNFTDTKASSTTVSSGKQPLTCDGCHSGNDYKVRTTTGGYKAGMGGFGTAAKVTVQFSNQGESNICIPCHAGLENGDSLKAGNYNFTNQSFVNPHYLTSAGVWQGVAGFKFYSSSAWYRVNNPFHAVPTADIVFPNEDITDSRISGADQKGSCVACHMGAKGDHKWDVFEAVKFKSYSSTVAYTGCLGCHSGTDNGRQRYYPTVATQPNRVASGGYVQQRGLDMLKWQLGQYNIVYTDAYPYFATKDWTTQVTLDPNTDGLRGLRTMGAAFNYKTLKGDKGAAAHNSYLTRHLIADSLVYLQKGAVGDRTAFVADVNQVISFTAYSTAITPGGGGAPTDGNPATIANLKQFLTTWTTAAGNGTTGVRLKQ